MRSLYRSLVILCVFTGAPASGQADPDLGPGPDTGQALPTPASADGAYLPALAEVTQGTLVEPQAQGGYRRLPSQQTTAELTVTGPVVRARVHQEFINDSPRWIEAIYAFPLPTGAAVDRLRMNIGDRVITGVIKPREAARTTYEAAKTSGKRASLVEQHRPNLFTTSVANIAPHGRISVEIEYQHVLEWRGEGFGLRVPLGITPRFKPGAGGAASTPVLADVLEIADGWAILPEELPNQARRSQRAEADRGSQPDAPLNPVTITVELDPGFPLAAVTSPSHALDQQRHDDGRVSVQLADGPVPADRDFLLRWQPAKGQRPMAAFFLEPPPELGPPRPPVKAADASTVEPALPGRGTAMGAAADTAAEASPPAARYGLLMVMPPADGFAGQGAQPREMVFIVDTSGSMAGASIRQARAALTTGLDRLGPHDHFNIIRFSGQAEALFQRSVPATPEHLAHGRRFVNRLVAGGGTQMRAALERAFAMPRVGGGSLRQLVFVTDGAVGNEQELFGLIQSRLGRGRLFTVGIGSAPNGHFMTEAAHFGRGSYTFIASVDEVHGRMTELFARLEHPALTDLTLRLPVAAETLPDPLPDLYLGEPLVVVLRLEGTPETASLEGRIGALPWQTRLNLRAARPQAGIGVLWGRQKIHHWMRQLSRGVDSETVRTAVTELALTHHLVSRYTSLVAVDTTPVRPPGVDSGRAALPTDPPAGWQPSATLPFAQGATPSRWNLFLGAAIAGLALATLAVTGRRRRREGY